MKEGDRKGGRTGEKEGGRMRGITKGVDGREGRKFLFLSLPP